MADRYHHGISLTEVSNTSRTIATVATAVIGLVATAPAAAADAFPLDRPVLVRDLDAAVVAAGAGGTLAATLAAIAATVRSFAAAHAVAMRALIDQEQGWHKTLSNVPLPAVTAGTGVVGIERDVTFDIQDPDCDANVLNAANVTTLVRINGELRFWGSRTTAGDANFAFESATRTAQILADTIAGGLVWAIDKPLTPGLARDIVEQCNAKFRAMKQAGVIFGAQAVFDGAKNPVDKLRTGILTIGYRYTPVPPLERLNLVQEISDEFLANFADLVANG
jgi:phage tail sheath protein FI